METLSKLTEEVKTCQKCPLHSQATKAVFGDGPSNAKIMLIGEAPGKNEDLAGLPFVGRAGELLTELLTAAGINRREVYITNVIKHRPPNNRDPTPNEVSACKPYLDQQINLINPEIIVPLGNHALEFVTGSKGITSMHGKLLNKNIAGKSRKIIPTFHPAALIYNRALRPDAEKDWELIKKEANQTNLSTFQT
jgi:DNA polymerase